MCVRPVSGQLVLTVLTVMLVMMLVTMVLKRCSQKDCSWVVEEMGCTVAWPFALKTDSQQAVSFADETCARSTVRGSFDWRVDWVNEIRDKKQVVLQHVYGNVNHADIMTKCMKGPARRRECCREL